MSHLGIRDDGPGQPPWCRGNATAVPATSKTAIAAGTVVLNRPPITRGTDSSNPSPSSGESRANLTYHAGADAVLGEGEIDRSGQISKCGDRMLRHLLYEAASALMTRTRKWSRLRAWGVSVAKRRGMKRATVAVARKLAVIMHRIWVTGGEFEFGSPAAAANAA